ncbi:hypothetical protein ACFL1B_02700 [Nanoarchaeota archaeon]
MSDRVNLEATVEEAAKKISKKTYAGFSYPLEQARSSVRSYLDNHPGHELDFLPGSPKEMDADVRRLGRAAYRALNSSGTTSDLEASDIIGKAIDIAHNSGTEYLRNLSILGSPEEWAMLIGQYPLPDMMQEAAVPVWRAISSLNKAFKMAKEKNTEVGNLKFLRTAYSEMASMDGGLSWNNLPAWEKENMVKSVDPLKNS